MAAKTRTAVIHVVEPGVRAPRGVRRCRIGSNVAFETESLESYFFSTWEPVAYDALLVAAAVEFADRTVRRTAYVWERQIELRVPVHDVLHWSGRAVAATLHDALGFLTGDRWHVTFYERTHAADRPQQVTLNLPSGVSAVIPYSNGLDSCAVAGLMARELGSSLVRIRLGSVSSDGEDHDRERQPFTAVPYKVRADGTAFVESSARSRGFKFALISGLAAYLAHAQRIIVPESGQGALGPSLVPVGQAYEDYRSHPLFTTRMEAFLTALLGTKARFEFPRLWQTKGETLRQFVDESGDGKWAATWSCWRQNRHVSVDGRRRQCGVCAACMLRRMSVHGAGLSEPAERYVWTDLSARTFEAGAAASYREKDKITRASREYAIAGALHLDHMASLPTDATARSALDLAAAQLGLTLNLTRDSARSKLKRLLEQHRTEWEDFMGSLGPDSFVADWAMRGRS
jgi:hypothetical protein